MTNITLMHQAALDATLDQRSLYLRGLALRSLLGGNRGHVGSTYSLIEILRVLYDEIMVFRADKPKLDERDRCILSKGHGCIALYAILADKGFFPIEELDSFCLHQSMLGGHPDANKVPGVEASTGALGHGFSIGVGIALACRVKGQDNRTYVIMGDGEINEGSVWEAAMSASKHQLGKLTAIIDYNKIQSYGPTRDVVNLEPLTEKWESFGFDVLNVNGHNISELKAAFAPTRPSTGKPLAVICHTIKGKGFSLAEDEPSWHHKSNFSEEQIAALKSELDFTEKRT